MVNGSWKPEGTLFTGDKSGNPEWHPGIVRDCCVLKLSPSEWFMYFQASAGHDTWNIGMAKSEDGISWKMHPTPVLDKGDAYDNWFLADPEVVYVDGKFHMFYEANADRRFFSCGYAESEDGVHWNRSAKPVLEPGSIGSYDTHDMSPLCILKMKDEWYLYYFVRPGGGGPTTTGLAISKDLKTWMKPFNHPILTPNPKWIDGAIINRVMWLEDRYVAWVGVRNVATIRDGTALAWSNDAIHWNWGPLIISGDFPYRYDIDVVKSNGNYLLYYNAHAGIDLMRFLG